MAFGANHFAVPLDFGLFVLEQVVFAIGEADETIPPFPVATITPFSPLSGMAKGCPPSQLVVELSRHPVKSAFGGTHFVVIGPTSNDGIELTNQPCL